MKGACKRLLHDGNVLFLDCAGTVVITQLYVFFKTHRTIYTPKTRVNFSICKLYLNFF